MYPRDIQFTSTRTIYNLDCVWTHFQYCNIPVDIRYSRYCNIFTITHLDTPHKIAKPNIVISRYLCGSWTYHIYHNLKSCDVSCLTLALDPRAHLYRAVATAVAEHASNYLENTSCRTPAISGADWVKSLSLSTKFAFLGKHAWNSQVRRDQYYVPPARFSQGYRWR